MLSLINGLPRYYIDSIRKYLRRRAINYKIESIINIIAIGFTISRKYIE